MIAKKRLQLVVMAAALAAGGVLIAAAASRAASAPTSPARYTQDGKLVFPADYRSWVYLSTGMDMSYVETPDSQGDMHMLDNVFVNRESWEAFQKTGTWPDKTVLVLEARRAIQNGSINKHGHFQADIMATEIHVKDQARFKDTGGWQFFGFRDQTQPGAMIPAKAGCIACHEAHGAVDTTFVQFYPTLLPKAQAMKTLSAAYLKDEAGQVASR
jgi:hypothetical protein